MLRDLPIGRDRFRGSESIPVRSPFDGTELGRVPRCGGAEVDHAVAVAKEVLDQEPLPQWRRAEILDTAATLLRDRADDFANLIAGEAAKPIRTSRVEAQRTASTFTFSAVEARRLAGEVVPLEASEVGAGKLAMTLRVPIGVIGAITPFNFPLNLVAHKVAPAIAAGCPVVLKPASQTPLSAIALADLLLDAGLPAGYLSVVTGPASEVGERIVNHPDIAMITFTGSPDVGWAIRAKAARKKVSLELGNNSPVIIEPDGDWESAAAKIAVAGYTHAGQSCISVQRVYVHHEIANPFCERLSHLVENLVTGDPLDERTDVSALISPSERHRVLSWIGEAEAGGAKVPVGGTVEGTILAPTVVVGATPAMKVCSEEVFGPLVAVATYSDLDEALGLANMTRFGLQAAIFTSHLSTALRAIRELDYGGVLVNEVPTWRSDQMPYGGLRDSGNTREGPRYAVAEMTESRLLVLQP